MKGTWKEPLLLNELIQSYMTLHVAPAKLDSQFTEFTEPGSHPGQEVPVKLGRLGAFEPGYFSLSQKKRLQYPLVI
jgi:hypothetical protein